MYIENNNIIVRPYRSIKQCYEEIKRKDPNTSYSLYYIRKIVNEHSNQIKHKRIGGKGSKVLVDLISLIEFLNIQEEIV